jgi:hypothetical protein
MPNIKFLKPMDQPTDTLRLLDELESCLNNPIYNKFQFAVAFAKIGPLLRLDSSISKWRSASKEVDAIFGIDHKGTSEQALSYALSNFNNAHYIHFGFSTFHPKFYLFSGPNNARAYVGSHNLTVGGTETNFEAGMMVDFDLTLSSDRIAFNEFTNGWSEILPHCSRLTATSLSTLITSNILLDENNKSSHRSNPTSSSGTSVKTSSSIVIKPPRPIPKGVMSKYKSTPSSSGTTTTAPTTSHSASVPGVTALAIQIAPKANGEILLSKVAVNQNPAFWGFPFTGWSAPKKATNPPYPQRTPDPVVNVNLYDPSGNLATLLTGYNLNTVYYTKKGEIRITFPSRFLPMISDYLMMVITQSSSSSVDYEIDIYEPGSTQYSHLLSICNQTLNSGGKPIARKMGWI